MNQIFSKNKNEKGQGLVEYVLIATFVGIVMIGALTAFGPQIREVSNGITGSVTGPSLNDGVLIIPGLGPTYTQVASSTPITPTLLIPTITSTFPPTSTFTPTIASSPTNTSTATITSSPTNTFTATALACTPGNATNIKKESGCRALRDANNCDDYQYNSSRDTCSWY